MEDQEKIWDTLANSWNNFRNRPEPIVNYFLNKYVKNKGKIVDLGCGNCRNLILFNDLKKYGVDFSQDMLDNAKTLIKKHNIKVRLFKLSLDNLPFKDNFFDYALMLASLHHLETKEKREKALEELYRILKKDGIALITVWDKWQLKFLFMKKNTLIPWKIKDKVYYRYYYLFNYFELKNLLRKNNFKILKSRFVKGNLMFIVKK